MERLSAISEKEQSERAVNKTRVDSDGGNSGLEQQSPSLGRGSTILFAALLCNIILKYGFNFGLGRLLSPSEYGVFGVGDAYITVLSIFITASFPWAVARFISAGKYGIIKAALLGNFIIAVTAGGILYVCFVCGILKLESGYYSIVIIVILTTLFSSLVNVYIGALQGAFKFKEVGILRTSGIFIMVVLGIIFVVAGSGPAGALAGYVLSMLVILGLAVYYTRDLKPFSGNWVEEKLNVIAWPLFIGILGISLIESIDIIGVKLFSPVGLSDLYSGYYKAALVWAKIPAYVSAAMVGALFPIISRYAMDKEKVNTYFTKIIKYIFVFILPLNLIFLFIPGELITLLYPQIYAQAGEALAILSIGTFLLVIIYILSTVFQATGEIRFPALILGSVFVIQVILLFLLVPGYGMNGAAIATTVSCIISLICLGVKYVKLYQPKVNVLDIGKITLAALILLGYIKFFPIGNKLLIALCAISSYLLFLLILAILRLIKPGDIDLILAGVLAQENGLRKSIVAMISKINSII
jgi:stage V sporulation protein B